MIAVPVEQERAESMLGASEAGAVLGLDKYSSPMTIWRRHRGLPTNDKENEAALWGQVLEPVVRGRYAIDRKVRVWVPSASYTLDGWLRATPDGIVPDPTTSEWGRTDEFDPREVHHRELLRWPEVAGGLSVKTCSAYLADEWIGGPPAKYEAQSRVEMAVVDLPWVDILCLVGGQKLVGPFRIERDMAIERAILERLRAFWSMVQDGREPTVDDSDAWRMHVSEKLGTSAPVEVQADAAMLDTVKRWKEARAARKAAERDEEAVKNELLLRLSAAGATKVDAGALGKPAAYRTKSGTWALRIPSFWRDE